MFRDDQQRSAVCKAMLASAGLEQLWKAAGPAEAARDLAAAGGGSLSGGERRLFLLAWELWTGEPTLPMSELLQLAPERLKMIASFLVAFSDGPEEIDRWLHFWAR